MRVGCPECGAAATVADSAAGKTVACPSCRAPMLLPIPVAQLVAPVPTARRVGAPVAKRSPLRATRAGADENDRPYEVVEPVRRSSRHDVDDEDDEPRRERQQDQSYLARNPDRVGWLATGAVAAIVAIVLLASSGFSKRSAIRSAPRTPPAGWSVAEDEHFSIFERGQTLKEEWNKDIVAIGIDRSSFVPFDSWISTVGPEQYSALSIKQPRRTPATEEALLDVIEREFRVSYHHDHVGRFLRERLGWTPQKPVRRERDEDAIG